MREAMLYDKLRGSVVKCNICQWRCTINPGNYGVCRMYQNRDGILYTLGYALVSSMAADPIEKKPLFHFFPDTSAMSFGGWGCNFHCSDCQNWEISTVTAKDIAYNTREISPQMAINLTKQYQCQGIAWTYNEPSMWFEYTLDSAKLAKENGLYTVYVTNGFLSPEALDMIGPYLDAWRVDIKGFSDTAYRRLAKITKWRGILEVAKRARTKWNMHVEVVTNVVPTLNDDDRQLEDIAKWIRDELGELTPWHVTRFHPRYRMSNMESTPLSTLEKAYDIGRRAGLEFVYIGNVPGHSSESTICYSCDNIVVNRYGYQTRIQGLEGSHCKFCGVELNFKQSVQGGWSA